MSIYIALNAPYAVRSLVYLKDHSGKAVTLKQIAAGIAVPAPFLSKILQNMTRHGLTVSERGSGGGFRLAFPADKINLRDIALAAAGERPLLKVPCLRNGAACARQKTCRLRTVWRDLEEVIEMQLRSRTLAQL